MNITLECLFGFISVIELIRKQSLAKMSVILLVSINVANAQDSILITQVNLIDVASGQVIPNTAVLVTGNEIISVDDSAPTILLDSTTVLDGRGLFLLPAFWDMHVHLSYARESALSALVANGVTLVRDVGSKLSEIDMWRGRIRAKELIGPEIVRSGPMLNNEAFNEYQLQVVTDKQARMAVRTLHNAGVDLVKLHRQTSREAYFAIADESKRLGIPFVGHIPVTVTPLEASNAGQATIEHTETFFEGTFMLENEESDLASAMAHWLDTEGQTLFSTFAKNLTAITPTLSIWRQIMDSLKSEEPIPNQQYIAQSAQRMGEQTLEPLRGFANEFVAERERIFIEAKRLVKIANEQNVTILAGTDLAAVVPGFSLHQELELLVEAGLTPLEALQAATTNPASLFPALKSGAIAPGMRADLLLLDANPLDNISNTQRINSVIIGGRLLSRAALDALLQESVRLAQDN